MSNPIARIAIAALAVVDALLFLYLFLAYGWFNFTFPDITDSIASIVIVPMIWGITILDRVVAAAFFAAVATGIWKAMTGRDRPLWVAMVSTPVLIVVFSAAAFVWIAVARSFMSSPPGMIHDRLTLFDALAAQMRISDIEMLGGVSYATGSYGAFLIVLLGVLYLAEKYLVQSWVSLWPVPITPLLAAAWIGVFVARSESQQRDYVNMQEWRAIGPQVSWIDALAACEKLGDRWRLPRREELVRYIASGPQEIRSWQGVAWTSAMDRNTEWAIGVDLAPRRSGRWNKASEPTRDESLCEQRLQQPGYANDWFVSYRDEVCELTAHSPYLYTPGLHLTARASGATVQLRPGAAVCIQSGSEPEFPAYQRRGYDEREFTSVGTFRAAMTERCRTSFNANRVMCYAYAGDVPSFDETDDERMMRAFCELVGNAEGCNRYADLMAKRPDAAERAERYRQLACKGGYAPACR